MSNATIDFDLNHPEFQNDLLALEKEDGSRFLAVLKKLSRMSWQQVYRDKGLNWEYISSYAGPNGQRLYSIRITKKFRAVVFREENYLTFLSLHPDHDSAYRR